MARLSSRCVPLLALVPTFVDAYASDPALQPTVLVKEGDLVPSIGLVTSIENLAVNRFGDWVLEIDTDFPLSTGDGIVLKNGLPTFQEGQPLSAPFNSSIASFDALSSNDAGHIGWNLFLDGTVGINDDSGIFFDDKLVIQEGSFSGAVGFSPATPYIGFFETKINASNQILVVASVDDPAVASTVDRALVLLTLNPIGGLVAETLIAKEGDVLSGQIAGVADFGTGPHNFALADNGSVMFFVDTTDVTTADGNIYLDSNPVAMEGQLSPIPGRTWLSLSSSRMDLSSNGQHHIFQGQLSAPTTDDQIILRDGAKLVQEGDTLPAIAPFKFTSFGTGGLRVSDSGDAVWIGDWDDPVTTKDVGLFLNHELLVQEGVTQIAGLTVESLATVQDNLTISGDGRYIVFEATLTGGVNGAFRIDRGPWTDVGFGDPGTNGQSRLLGSGQLVANTPVSFTLANAAPNSAVALILGVNQVNLPLLGGVLVPSPDVVIQGLPADANGHLFLTSTWPVGPAGFTFYAQMFYADPGASAGVASSNGIAGTTQ